MTGSSFCPARISCFVIAWSDSIPVSSYDQLDPRFPEARVFWHEEFSVFCVDCPASSWGFLVPTHRGHDCRVSVTSWFDIQERASALALFCPLHQSQRHPNWSPTVAPLHPTLHSSECTWGGYCLSGLRTSAHRDCHRICLLLPNSEQGTPACVRDTSLRWTQPSAGESYDSLIAILNLDQNNTKPLPWCFCLKDKW